MQYKYILIALLFITHFNVLATENRVALIIGNSNYATMGELRNASNDAEDMAQVLTELGFDVISGVNLSKKQMSEKIRTFDAKLSSGNKDETIGLFYYAGHGLEVEGKNYLVPIDADMQYQEDASDEGIPLNRVIKRMNYSKNRMNIVILDACRNNPLPKRDRAMGSGGWGAFNDVASGMFIAYGTAPGRKAADGIGRNGLFTKHILKNIKTPEKTLEQVFKSTRLGVLNESNKKQITWQNNATTGDFYFVSSKNNNTHKASQVKTQNKLPANFSLYNRARPKAGKIYKDCPECPSMVVIPAGSFEMGSNANRKTSPAHRVTLKSFALSESEITYRQWQACFKDGKCPKKPSNDSKVIGNRPVVDVSWVEAQMFIHWLKAKTGKVYRLPSESEWEYAAKAGADTKFSWGNSIDCSQAWYGQSSNECGEKVYHVAVKSFQPNPFGLYEMHGNVFEWVQDKWHANYQGAPNDGSAWEAEGVKSRMIRGGSMGSSGEDLSTTSPKNREGFSPTTQFGFIGFRIAQDIE